MAIQKINLGTEPLGEGGDTYRSANTKINENFSNQTHAASRLVGEDLGNVLPVGAGGLLDRQATGVSLTSDKDIYNVKSGFYFISQSSLSIPNVRPSVLTGQYDTYFLKVPYTRSGAGGALFFPYFSATSGQIVYRTHGAPTAPITDYVFYTDKNTKLDTNGAIAPSSPTIDLYSDHIETNADGSRMNPEFIRNGVGDYTIKNTTGLRDDGWYIKIPNDMNGNPKVAVAIDTDKDGNLNIKTYKRTFSMETFTFGPDLNEPLDIPEGRWIDLRFNDLPEEELHETEPEEDPIVDEVEESEEVDEPVEVPEEDEEEEPAAEEEVEEPEVVEEESPKEPAEESK